MPVSVTDARLEALHRIDDYLNGGVLEFIPSPLLTAYEVRQIYEPLGWEIRFADGFIKFSVAALQGLSTRKMGSTELASNAS